MLLAAAISGPAAADAGGIAMLAQQAHWGEGEDALLRRFGGRATLLPWRLDYGDAYADIVLRSQPVGGYRFIVTFQMDKKTGGLARIQLERPHHAAGPPSFRAALAELAAAYGDPDRECRRSPRPENGYQAVAERRWRRGDAVIRAILRDTTLEAGEGCFSLVAGGPCGLGAQLLLRISQPGRDPEGCGD